MCYCMPQILNQPWLPHKREVSPGKHCGAADQALCAEKILTGHALGAAVENLDPGRPVTEHRNPLPGLQPQPGGPNPQRGKRWSLPLCRAAREASFCRTWGFRSRTVRSLSFAQELNRSVVPFVQWGIADKSQSEGSFQMYNIHEVNMVDEVGTCAVWDICSRNQVNHPFHVHVHPFQILDIRESFLPGTLACAPPAQALLRSTVAEPLFRFRKGEWRDTAWVPPCGCLKIKQCYDAGAPRVRGGEVLPFEGKHVFHCHFLTHEDTGLIHNVMLRRPLAQEDTSSPGLWLQKFKGHVTHHASDPRKFPGAVVPSDTSACPVQDPCGVLPGSRGCSLCPDHTWTNTGCTCMQPLPLLGRSERIAPQARAPRSDIASPSGWLRGRGLGARALAAAATVGVFTAVAAFGLLLAVQRLRPRQASYELGTQHALEADDV
jgi:hypothetical protein